MIKPVQPEPVENGSKEPEPEAVVVGAKEQVESVNSEVKEEAPSPCSPPLPGKSNSLSLKPFTVKAHAVYYNGRPSVFPDQVMWLGKTPGHTHK